MAHLLTTSSASSRTTKPVIVLAKEGQGINFRWTQLETGYVGRAIEEHERYLRYLKNATTTMSPNATVHTNGRLRGLLTIGHERVRELRKFVEEERHMYGPVYNRDKLAQLEGLAVRLAAAVKEGEQVSHSSEFAGRIGLGSSPDQLQNAFHGTGTAGIHRGAPRAPFDYRDVPQTVLEDAGLGVVRETSPVANAATGKTLGLIGSPEERAAAARQFLPAPKKKASPPRWEAARASVKAEPQRPFPYMKRKHLRYGDPRSGSIESVGSGLGDDAEEAVAKEAPREEEEETADVAAAAEPVEELASEASVAGEEEVGASAASAEEERRPSPRTAAGFVWPHDAMVVAEMQAKDRTAVTLEEVATRAELVEEHAVTLIALSRLYIAQRPNVAPAAPEKAAVARPARGDSSTLQALAVVAVAIVLYLLHTHVVVPLLPLQE